jgi:hypothetical protein
MILQRFNIKYQEMAGHVSFVATHIKVKQGRGIGEKVTYAVNTKENVNKSGKMY